MSVLLNINDTLRDISNSGQHRHPHAYQYSHTQCTDALYRHQDASHIQDMLYVKKAKQFADLIEKMTTLDPERLYYIMA